ncbi:MAG: nucleotidyltransferase domain-containing protein [Candidatus Methanospirareceae archaeon]
MRLRIRDFVVTKREWIFAVVRYEFLESEEAWCLLRYVPDKRGERISEERGRFKKLSFSEAYEFLRLHCPRYIKGGVHVVPKGDIREVLRPEEGISKVVEREEKVRIVYEMLKERIPKENIGITGSFLCGLNSKESDMDFVIYGRRNFDRARDIIEEAKEEGIISPIDEEMWRRIYDKRMPELSYEEFVAHEKRKRNRGRIGDSYFDILYVRDWDEIEIMDKEVYERGKKIGYAKIRGEVKEASFAFDSPAIYEIEHPLIKKVLCFTHTYAGQAVEGEMIEARGVVERTERGMRLVVGTTREAKGEWIKSLSLLSHEKEDTNSIR